MQNEVSKDEMKTLLNLMQRIEKFEVLNRTQNWAIERLAWGVLLIIGGVLDFVILYFTREILGYLNTIAWILILATGLLMSNFLRKNVFISVRKRKSSFFVKTQFYWILISIGMIFIFGYTELDHLTIPLIAIMMGIVFLIDNYLSKRKAKTFVGIILHYITPVFCILTAIVNLIGFYVVGEIFELYYGIIFGCVTGLILAYGAFLLRNIVTSNKITSIEDLSE